MCTEPKASYRTVQYEYAYRYTPNIYIYIKLLLYFFAYYFHLYVMRHFQGEKFRGLTGRCFADDSAAAVQAASVGPGAVAGHHDCADLRRLL